MTHEPWWKQRREAIPTTTKYLAIAAAFTVAWAHLSGNADVAISLSKVMGVGFLALGVSELAFPLAASVGGRIGEWWRSRKGVST